MRTVCSCVNLDEPVNHAKWCELWLDYSFKHGTAIWSREFFRLVGFLEWASAQAKERGAENIDSLSELWPATDRLRNTEHRVVTEDESLEADKASRLVEIMDEIEAEVAATDDSEVIIIDPAGDAYYETAEYVDMDEDDNEDEEYTDCPHCGNFFLCCVECGFQIEDCECAELEGVYCPQCSHIFELVAREDEDEDEVTTVNIGRTTQPVDDDEDDEFIPATCFCTPPKQFCCMEDGVARSKKEDPWHYISSYDPACVCKPPKLSYCHTCGAQKKNGRWVFISSEWVIKNDRMVRKDSKTSGTTGGMYGSFGGYPASAGGGTYVAKCRHREFTLKFPDGTKVWASSMFTRDVDALAPDFGLYLASSWDAACLAYTVAWPDMSIPKYPKAAVAAIVDCFEKARSGLTVEVGCIGGHGRTGTALACMAVLGGVPPADAVEWVRTNYCQETVESERQEWWVLWFADFVLGTNNAGPCPEPKKYVSNYIGAKSFKVTEKGATVTYWFENDWKDSNKKYTVRDVVRLDKKFYLCVSSHNANKSNSPVLEDNRNLWEPISEGFVPKDIVEEYDKKLAAQAAQAKKDAEKKNGGGSGKAPSSSSNNSTGAKTATPAVSSVTPGTSQSATAGDVHLGGHTYRKDDQGEWSKVAPDSSTPLVADGVVADDARFHTPTNCLKPACGASMPYGFSECPECGLAYADGFWTWHVERQRIIAEQEEEIAYLAGVAPVEQSSEPEEIEQAEVGEIVADMVWTGILNGWQPVAMASTFLPDFYQPEKIKTVERKLNRKDRKRQKRHERRAQNKKNKDRRD